MCLMYWEIWYLLVVADETVNLLYMKWRRKDVLLKFEVSVVNESSKIYSGNQLQSGVKSKISENCVFINKGWSS
jgi:hypothetical protein